MDSQMTLTLAVIPSFTRYPVAFFRLAPNSAVLESGVSEFLGVVDVAAIDDEGVLHGLLHHAEARHAELLPFGDEQQCVGIEQCFVHVVAVNNLACDCRGIGARGHTALAFVHGDRVEHTDGSAGLDELVDEHEGGRFAHVISFWFEGEAPHGDGLALEVRFSAEALCEFVEKYGLLVFVDFFDGLEHAHLVAVLLGGLDEGLHILGPFRLMRVASMEFAAYLIISALGMSVKITRKLLSIIGRWQNLRAFPAAQGRALAA